MRLYRLFIFMLLLFSLSSCSKKIEQKRSFYIIAYPTQWHHIPLYGSDKNVTGFSSDLLYGIAKEAGIEVRLVAANPTNFPKLLDRKEVDAVLTAMPVTFITKKFLDFTDPYFVSGTVIVVRARSPYSSTKELKNVQLGYDQDDGIDIILGTSPQWLIYPYENPFRAIEDVLQGKIDGMILNYINAIRLRKTLYRSRLKILSPPLVRHTIRLAVKQGQNKELITFFNEGVKKFMESDKYTELLEYWGIQSYSAP